MKKIFIILAIILTTGLTAISIARSENKTDATKINTEKAALSAQTNAPANRLATAD